MFADTMRQPSIFVPIKSLGTGRAIPPGAARPFIEEMRRWPGSYRITMRSGLMKPVSHSSLRSDGSSRREIALGSARLHRFQDYTETRAWPPLWPRHL